MFLIAELGAIRLALLEIFALELNRRVSNPKALGQLVIDSLQQPIITGWIWLHQMNRESGFGGAQCPDMQMMRISDCGDSLQITPHFGNAYSRWHGVHRQVKRVTQQAPGAADNDRVDEKAHGGIQPMPAGE